MEARGVPVGLREAPLVGDRPGSVAAARYPAGGTAHLRRVVVEVVVVEVAEPTAAVEVPEEAAQPAS